MLFVDYAGDKLTFTNIINGENVSVDVQAACNFNTIYTDVLSFRLLFK